ncbi:ATP synthase E chain-domain-containing protein [Phycomyces nitens]|nr:ATP synthase E chain-domain-containing protein [Phycomyces nitens]
MSALRSVVNVGRWSALAFGVAYGFSHNRSLKKQEKEKEAQREYKHKEELIEKARAEYARRTNPSVLAVASDVKPKIAFHDKISDDDLEVLIISLED